MFSMTPRGHPMSRKNASYQEDTKRRVLSSHQGLIMNTELDQHKGRTLKIKSHNPTPEQILTNSLSKLGNLHLRMCKDVRAILYRENREQGSNVLITE